MSISLTPYIYMLYARVSVRAQRATTQLPPLPATLLSLRLWLFTHYKRNQSPGWAGRVKQLLVACSAVELVMRACRCCKAVVHGRYPSCMVTHLSLGCSAPFMTWVMIILLKAYRRSKRVGWFQISCSYTSSSNLAHWPSTLGQSLSFRIFMTNHKQARPQNYWLLTASVISCQA
jgi:uncharacterized membrane protein YhdT